MSSPLFCPACRVPLPLDGIETDANGRARTTCPACRAPLVWQVRIEHAAPVRDERPGLSPEARLAALGDAPQTPTRRRLAVLRRFTGLLVCLLLLATLIAQHAVFRTTTWIENEHLRPIIQGVCAELGCRPPLPRDPAYLRIVERQVGPIPDVPGALRVELVFENTAPFALPPPWLELTFYDALRRPVAGRRFRPREYLPEDRPIDRALAAGRTIRSRIDIVDPGRSALGFEFHFGYDPAPNARILWPGAGSRGDL